MNLQTIQTRIYDIGGHKVMLDFDLDQMSSQIVTTWTFKLENMRSQIVTTSGKKRNILTKNWL